MRIGITDSGVGGLSVCAEVEARLRREPVRDDLEIFYLNAALRDDYSYNAMPSRQQKLETFDGFLRKAAERYRPDILYIACNSLSVLFGDPYFERLRTVPTRGIVETGVASILSALETRPEAPVIVFATPTTVEEGTYRDRLLEAGIASERIAQQACPGLPDAISNDFSGGQAMKLLQRFVPEALARFDAPPARVAAFLGCTHYGYQAALFERLLGAHVDEVCVLDPNAAAAASIIAMVGAPPGSGKVKIRFVTPYEIPERPLESLPIYLGEKAPGTVAALRNFRHDPALYGA